MKKNKVLFIGNICLIIVILLIINKYSIDQWGNNAVEYKNVFCGNNNNCIVAVIDTGINYHIIDDKNLWTNIKEIPDDGIDNDDNGYIDDYYGWNFYANTNVVYDDLEDEEAHGTFISSILSNTDKRYVSLLHNTNCKIMCIKALNSVTSEGKEQSIISAIKYAEDNGAQIVNLSIATYKESSALKKVIRDSDMLFIVPAANDGQELGRKLLVYPACWHLDNIISVAATNKSFNICGDSNYSKKYIDVCAPGDRIAGFLDKKRYYMSGTSCAVPYVTALAALVYDEIYANGNVKWIKEYICNNCIQQKRFNSYVKYGMINYSNALKKNSSE